MQQVSKTSQDIHLWHHFNMQRFHSDFLLIVFAIRNFHLWNWRIKNYAKTLDRDCTDKAFKPRCQSMFSDTFFSIWVFGERNKVPLVAVKAGKKWKL